MVYAPHALVSLSGTWNAADAGKEVWAMTLKVRRSGTTGYLSAPDAYITDIQAGIASWWAVAGNKMSNKAILKTLKVNNIGPDGKYTDTVTHMHDYGAGIAGGAAPTCSADNSLVWSWTTAASRGRSSRGRIYPPNNTFTLAGAFSIATSDADQQIGVAKSFLNLFHVNSDGDATLVNPVVCSKLDGNYRVITGVEIGTVYDTQRRRRNRVPEVYSAYPWP